MSVYRIPNSPFYYFDVTVEGRRVRRSTRKRDRNEALNVEARERAAIVSGAVRRAAGKITLDEALTRYYEEHAEKLPSAATIDGINARTLEHFGATATLDVIDDSAVSTWMASLRRRISDATANRYLANLRSVFNMARDQWGLALPRPPNWRRHMLAEPEPRQEYLTKSEAKRLVEAAAPHIKPVIMFALMTGLRYSNVVRLDWSQVDLEHGQITFRVKARRPGGKVHVLPITSAMRKLLLTLGPKASGPVFTRNGHPFRWIKRSYKAALKAAGLRDLRFHDLRHTAATWMVQDGVPLDVVQGVLGHASIQMTQRYAKRQVTAKLDAMEGSLSALVLTENTPPKEPRTGCEEPTSNFASNSALSLLGGEGRLGTTH